MTRERCECGRGPKIVRNGAPAALAGCADCIQLDGDSPARHDILMLLRVEGQPCSTAYIAAQYGQSHRTVGKLLHRMQARGLVKRRLWSDIEYHDVDRWGQGAASTTKTAQAFWSPVL